MAMQADETVHRDLRQWLLGLLPQEESLSLEERLITDAALYEELHIAEDDLIDDYLAGRLTANERKGFETYFMNSPERQEQFRIANALRVYIDDSKQGVSNPKFANASPQESSLEPPKPAAPTWAPFRKTIATVSLAAAALLVVVFGWWAVSLRSPSSVRALSVILTPGGQTREGGPTQTVNLTPDAEYLHLHLRLARNDFQEYRAILVNSEGDVIQTSENLRPTSDSGGPTIQLPVKTAQIPPGEYLLKLDGVGGEKFERADSYHFQVLTQ